jgi:hypothetical protein
MKMVRKEVGRMPVGSHATMIVREDRGPMRRVRAWIAQYRTPARIIPRSLSNESYLPQLGFVDLGYNSERKAPDA